MATDVAQEKRLQDSLRNTTYAIFLQKQSPSLKEGVLSENT